MAIHMHMYNTHIHTHAHCCRADLNVQNSQKQWTIHRASFGIAEYAVKVAGEYGTVCPAIARLLKRKKVAWKVAQQAGQKVRTMMRVSVRMYVCVRYIADNTCSSVCLCVYM